MKDRRIRGVQAYFSGLNAEAIAVRLLEARGLTVLARRVRTPFGEIDLIVADQEWLIAVEVKKRKNLADGAAALSPKQSTRLIAAFDYILMTCPDWQRPKTRLDLIAVDPSGQARRIQDALRLY